jgi:formylglycine-generating enzyme required for sulfatase activity
MNRANLDNRGSMSAAPKHAAASLGPRHINPQSSPFLNMTRHAHWLTFGLLALSAIAGRASFVYETDKEFFVAGDFNGDGRTDVAVVSRFLDKYQLESRYRIAYQTAPGVFEWQRVHMADIPKASGVAVGRLLDEARDALAITAPEANLINVIDLSDPDGEPVITPYLGATLGPSVLVAIDIGGDDNTALDDLVISTIYNAPVEHHLELLRNDGAAAMPLEDIELDGEVARANRVVLKAGGPPLAAAIIRTPTADEFRVADVRSGQPVPVLTVEGLSRGSDYVVGRFGSSSLATLVFFASGSDTITARTLTESEGQYTAGEPRRFPLGRSVRSLAVAGEGDAARLLVLFGNGDEVGVMSFDGVNAPKVLQSIKAAEDEAYAGLVPVDGMVFAVMKRPAAYSSMMCQVWKTEGAGFTAGPTAEASTYDHGVYLIEPLLRARADKLTPADMKPYTNTISGTKVAYAMVPIPGGEFVIGTPESEAHREDSESPQVRIKLDPFWMQTTEVTWDLYSLFMFPDEEKRFKDSIPTDPEFDRASDAVARPSKPYTEMSFGMGKDGFPAISMTHHAAVKFCQWLSAKTGHFYRLPTEAEWEYACRAGTQTAYSWGDSEDAMDDHAWYEENSDFTYKRVGRKKPNAWGLHDMHGNVMEWCLDGMLPDYSHLGKEAINPWVRPTKPYPHVARGGSYDDPADRLRSGARIGSDRAWKMTDPQLPKSAWWLSDNKMIGLRVVRPITVPDPETLARFWNSGTERE